MELKIRLTNQNDYPELVSWWRWHRFPAPDISLLDDLRFGLMVTNGTENICSGFVYFTNARAYGMIEYIVSSYKVRDKKIRQRAIILLICSLQEMAKQKGVKVLYTSLRNPHLVKHYQNCGFIIGSENTKEMICKL